jgi:hypothetical protein
MSACVCVCARVSVCVHLQACARARVCVRVCVPLSANVRVRAIPSDCNSARVCSERVCAPRRCARPPIARRRLAVFIARPAPRVAAARAVAFGATGRLWRAFGRRCHLDEPHDQRAVGRAILAHVGGRRRRRRLRHRRLRLGRRRQQGRVGEHRRRCAGRTRSMGVLERVLRGYYGGTQGYKGVV